MTSWHVSFAAHGKAAARSELAAREASGLPGVVSEVISEAIDCIPGHDDDVIMVDGSGSFADPKNGDHVCTFNLVVKPVPVASSQS